MTTLGRYQIVDKLGTGSMGTVYRAQDTVLDREVALKTIRTEGDIHPELRERFYREARACARLQHPSIVVVHDLGEIDQVAYIAMELLDGSDFRKLIEQRAEIPLATKLEVMAQVCDALAYAHRRGIVHRDIKPSNLFLIEKRHAKVLDFGIARLPSSKLTQRGKVLGTPNYMAPEQIQGRPPDGRSDLFSAAVVFFEFLVYEHPFQGDNIPRRIVEDPPDSLRAAERKLPVLLERVFGRALAKEPDRRYQTGDEFAADLRAVYDLLVQNASPSFSRAPLPSERDVAVRTAPAADDLYDTRLSELMQLIPEFEDAIAQGDTDAARQILVRLEAIAAADSRCAEPVRLCRARLAEVSAPTAESACPPETTLEASPAVDPPAREQGTGSGMKTCPHCGAANRSAAVYCIQCGVQMIAVPPPEPNETEPGSAATAVEAATGAGLDATTLFRPAGAEARVPPAGPAAVGESVEEQPAGPKPVGVVPAPAPRPSLLPAPGCSTQILEWLRRQWALSLDLVRKQKQVALLAGVLLAAVAIMIIIARPPRPVRVEPWTVQARIKPRLGSIYASANTRSPLMTVPRGEYIHVDRPYAQGQEWIRVQVVRKDKAWLPGYMHVADLDNWFSQTPVEELRLLLLQQEIPGNNDEIKQKIYDVNNSIYNAEGSPDVPKAYLYMCKLELRLATNLKAEGKPEGEWINHVDSAKKDRESDTGAEDEAASEDLQRQIAALTEPAAPAPTEQPPTPPAKPPVHGRKQIEDRLKQAQDSFNQSMQAEDDATKRIKLDEAEAAAKKVLEWDKTNDEAQKLLERIKERRKVLFNC